MAIPVINRNKQTRIKTKETKIKIINQKKRMEEKIKIQAQLHDSAGSLISVECLTWFDVKADKFSVLVLAAVVVVIVVLGDWCKKVVGLEVDEDCVGVVRPQPSLKENGAGSVERIRMRKEK